MNNEALTIPEKKNSGRQSFFVSESLSCHLHQEIYQGEKSNGNNILPL